MATSKMLDFFPEKFVAIMNEYQNSEEDTTWGIGRVANAFWNENKDYWINEGWTKDNYWSAVGELCGISKHTVRMRMEVEAAVPVALRDAYPLTFHAHRAILPHSGGDPKEHEKIILDWLATADKYGGKIGGIDALRYWLNNRDGAPPWWMGAIERILRQVRKLAGCDDAPDEVRKCSSEYVGRLEKWDE